MEIADMWQSDWAITKPAPFPMPSFRFLWLDFSAETNRDEVK